MIEKKRFKFEWLIIGLLLVIIAFGGIFLFGNKRVEVIKNGIDSLNTKNQLADTSNLALNSQQKEALQRYEKLELAYNNTISEIEKVVDDKDINLSILKENLNQILSTIKDEKNKINKGGDSIKNSPDNTKELEDLLNMSKEVLAERLLEEKTKNEKLTIDNRKLNYNLKKSITHFEDEKSKNVELNAEVAQIKSQINSIQSEGEHSTTELKELQRQKDEIEKKLVESNKSLKVQTEQIQELGEIIRNVNVDCYYFYEKDNAAEEAKIYLTSQGVAEKYVKYFVRKKPDIYVEFKLSKDFFNYNVEKVDLKLYNSLNVEIYSISKVVGSENFKIIIPNKNFDPGKYSIELKAGDENLILDDRYSFKISN
jgi:hypothetical protein